MDHVSVMISSHIHPGFQYSIAKHGYILYIIIFISDRSFALTGTIVGLVIYTLLVASLFLFLPGYFIKHCSKHVKVCINAILISLQRFCFVSFSESCFGNYKFHFQSVITGIGESFLKIKRQLLSFARAALLTAT